MAAKMEFKRGDGATATLRMPATSWSPGGKLFFTAKQAVDDDLTDSSAKIDVTFGDDVVTDEVYKGVAVKKYTCYFPAAATNSINTEGADFVTLVGEFQYVPVTGDPITFPGRKDRIQVIVYADVRRKTV